MIFFSQILTNNNLLFKIYCENIVITFPSSFFLFFPSFFILHTWHFFLFFSFFPLFFPSFFSSPHMYPYYFLFYPSIGLRFSDRAPYNEFVENGSKCWGLMRWRLVLGVKNTKDWMAQRPREKGSLAWGRESPSPLASQESLSFSLASPPLGWSLLLYIPLFRSSSSYICQSSMPILECTSHRPLFLALCELLWPPTHCPGVTFTSMGSGC